MATDKHSETLTATDVDAPPPPYSSISGSTTLHVHYRYWKSSIIIKDSNNQDLFALQGDGCSPRLQVRDRNSRIVGFSKTSLTSKIDVEMCTESGVSRTFEVHNSAGILGGSPGYTSPAFGGDAMVWKNKAMSINIVYELVDGRGTTLAKFQSDRRTKVGNLEIAEVTGEDRINEVAVTLLTLLHRKLRNIETATLVAVT